MLNFFFIGFCVVLLIFTPTMSGAPRKKSYNPPAEHSYLPPGGYVPDERVAIAIAEVVATPIYGAKQIRSERPLRATLKGDVWTVTGTLPQGAVGGTLLVEISKKSGCILRMIHGL